MCHGSQERSREIHSNGSTNIQEERGAVLEEESAGQSCWDQFVATAHAAAFAASSPLSEQ